MPRDFTHADTMVFWDVEDFPIPEGRDLYWFRETLKSTLVNVSYHGDVSINAYGLNKQDDVVRRYTDAKISFQHIDSKYRRVNRMLVDMCFWAHDYPCSYDNPRVLLVIAKGHKSADFTDYLLSLAHMKFTVILVSTMAGPFPPVIHTWIWENLFLADA